MRWSDYCNKILASVDIEEFYYSELRNIVRRGTEIKASCPFSDLHEGGQDVNPSFTVNLDKGVYYCNTCHSKGNVHTFYKTLMKLSNDEAWYALGDALNVPRPEGTSPPQIDTSLPGKYYKQLNDLGGNALSMLRNRRGLSSKSIKRFQLGWDLERITIPVYDMYNNLVNIRRYKWDSYEDGRKMINYVDDEGNAFGEVRIFNIQALLNNDAVVWCEGELDAIISEQNGIPACCPTSGAGTFRQEWLPLFKNKTVYLCQDNDQPGRDANESLRKRLQGTAYKVIVIDWPDYMPEKGDITDFYVNLGKSPQDFMSLMVDTAYVGSEPILNETAEALYVDLQDSTQAKYVGKRVAIPAMVSGKGDTPYMVPRHIKCSCRGPGENDKKCSNCALSFNGYDFTHDVDVASPEILKLIDVPEEKLHSHIKKLAGINAKCDAVEIAIDDYFNLEAVRLIPKAITDYFDAKEREYVTRMAYISDKEIRSNRRYTLYGYLYPDPKTQAATHIIDDFTPEKDLASSFELTNEAKKLLCLFKPKAGQSIADKFKEVHKDFERNVTQVWQRHDVQIAVELIYHTVIGFQFQGQPVKRGWGEVLIIGDSGQAKTTITERLMRHFQLGEMHNGESSRRTGLVYNMQQAGSRWFLSWGALPLNDSGLVVLDELSGISQEDLAVMSDVRSSGVARSTGVVTAETNARTRIVFLSNPRNGRQLKTESFGAEAVLKLLGKAEDVRRLDLVVGVASGDVDAALVNQYVDRVEPVPHVYTTEACKIRVLWAWTRKTEDIEFTPEAVEYILTEATRMGKMYSPRIPIVEGADQRLKIARLAISAAICTCSTDEAFEKVIVTRAHAKFVVDYMDRVYAAPALNYLEMSKQDIVHSDTSAGNMTKLRQQFLGLMLPDITGIAAVMYQLPYFSKSTLEDYTGLDREDIKLLMKYLTGSNLIEKYKGEYRRRPIGTALFQNLVDSPPEADEIAVAKKSYGAAATF